MKKRILIGLDVGTSGAKCIAADEEGAVLASFTEEYPLYTPFPGWAEQDPEDWWQAVIRGLNRIVEKINVEDVVGISFSGQMHGLVALDKDLRVIRPAFLWCDQRTEEQCLRLTEKAGGLEKLLTYTNNRMLSGYTGGKLIWLMEKEPANYDRMQVFLCPKDYVRYRITGKAGMDVSEASGTGFFDTRNRRWSEELIGIAGLRRNIFPEVSESIDFGGGVTEEAALLTGLKKGTPCYFGGGDAVIQSTGSGLISPGTIGVVIGTAGNVSMGLDHFYDNPHGDLQMFCNNEPGLYHAFGCPLTSGGAYRWYRDELCQHLSEKAALTEQNVYDLMGKEAEMSVPGSHGVIFTPYLTGERCPYPDAHARASFYGLSLKTTRADITRSVMEGVTFSLKQIVDIMTSFTPCDKVVTSGGGSVSALWRQMQADVFDMPVVTTSASKEGGAYGAVMAAGVGAGVWKNLEEAVSIVKTETETWPVKENQKGYMDSFDIYERIYPALKSVYDFSASKGF